MEVVTARRPPETFHFDCGWQTTRVLEDVNVFGHVSDGNLHKYEPFIAPRVRAMLCDLNVCSAETSDTHVSHCEAQIN